MLICHNNMKFHIHLAPCSTQGTDLANRNSVAEQGSGSVPPGEAGFIVALH
jgi:hypothetical protein